MAALQTAIFLAFLMISVISSKNIRGSEDYLNDFLDYKSESISSPRVQEDVNWPGFPYLKQVSGLSVDGDGNLHIFHRGDRIWDLKSFTLDNHLRDAGEGPIPNDTIIVVDTTNGKILYTWGANRFYMPHGIAVDRKGNTWVTDVGLHQVLKFNADQHTPELVIGETLSPGHDSHHLCKPTDVAVLPTGTFFVSDGYCNSRLLMFSKNGRLLKEIGTSDSMVVPHSLTLIPQHDAVCVADRENGRVLCYATGTDGTEPGDPLASFEQAFTRLFAVDTRGNQLFAVNGPDLFGNSQSVASDHGIVLDIESGSPKTFFGPEKGFRAPHDLSVSPDGNFVYISETDVNAPKRVYKFAIQD